MDVAEVKHAIYSSMSSIMSKSSSMSTKVCASIDSMSTNDQNEYEYE